MTRKSADARFHAQSRPSEPLSGMDASEFQRELVEFARFEGYDDLEVSDLTNKDAIFEAFAAFEPVQRPDEPDDEFDLRYFIWQERVEFMYDAWEELIQKQTSVESARSPQCDPPGYAERLMYLVLPAEQRECVPGDLEEEFRTIVVPKFGLKYARIWHWWQSIRSCGRFALSQVLSLLTFGLAQRVDRFLSRWVGR